jgi:hypothetical protein
MASSTITHSGRTAERLFDVRTVERNLRKGTLSKKDFDKHLKTLPDVAEKAQSVDPDAVDDDDDDTEE